MPYIAKNTTKPAEARVERSNEKGIVAEPAIHDRLGLGATGKQRGDLTVRFHLCRKADIEKIEEHAHDMAGHSLTQCKACVEAFEGQERGSASDAVICDTPNIDMCARLRGKADTMRARSVGETATIRPEGSSKGQAIDFDASTANRTTEMADRPPKLSRESAFLPLAAMREHAAAVLGLACMFAWVELLFCFEVVLRDQVESAGGLVHDPLFRTATLVAAMLFVGITAINALKRPCTKLSALQDHRTMRVLSGIAGAVCSACAALLAGLWPTAPITLSCLAGAGVGWFIAWGTLSWGNLLACLDLREALLIVSGAACLQWLPFLFAPMLPCIAQAICIALLAVACCFCLTRATSGEPLGTKEPEASNAAGCPSTAASSSAATVACRTRANATQKGETFTRKLAALSFTMFAFSLVIEFIWCFFIKMLPGRLSIGLFPAIFACVTVITVGVIAGCIAIMERQHGYRLELFYRLMMLSCLCGVAATGAAAPGDSTAQQFTMYTLVYLGYSLAGPTMWLLALGYAHMRRAAPTAVLGCVFASKYLGLFCGFGAVDLLGVMGAGEVTEPGLVPNAVLVCVTVLACAYLIVFPERELLSLSPLLFGLSSESIETRCAQIAAEHGLTPRETEVFTLLARGRDVGFICAELYISRNTANAHRRAIYSKLGIHSQQELLDIVEDGLGGE